MTEIFCKDIYNQTFNVNIIPSGKTGPGAKNPSFGSSDDEFCLIRNPKAIASSAACLRFKATLNYKFHIVFPSKNVFSCFSRFLPELPLRVAFRLSKYISSMYNF